jgi:ankyrin repeat protein
MPVSLSQKWGLSMEDLDELGNQLLSQAGSGNDKIVRELVTRGANVNYPDEEIGDRPLHRAAMEGHAETVLTLIELGADVNAADNLGERPLHWAADGGHLETVKLLIEKGAQITAENCEGKTAADWAARENRTEVETFLRKLEALKRRGSQRER